MGFDTDAYHATSADADFNQFIPSDGGIVGDGVYMSKDAQMVDKYIMSNGEYLPNSRVMPVKFSGDYKGYAGQIAISDPRNIRSRFAAFDPMRRDSSDLLAGLALPVVAAPVVSESNKKKRKDKKK